MKYIKKPIAIEAFSPSRYKNHREWPEWALIALADRTIKIFFVDQPNEFYEIKTLMGAQECLPQDYIIKWPFGEIYCCKKEIFEETYEAVKEYILPENTPKTIYIESSGMRLVDGIVYGRYYKSQVNGGWEVDGPGQWLAYSLDVKKCWLEEAGVNGNEMAKN